MQKVKSVYKTIKPEAQHWVGDGFYVHTMFHPKPELNPYISPFLLLDYAPEKTFTATDKRRGVGEHPHRGFETVTFAIQGEIEHRDSSGGGGIITPGGVQWMTAGAGIVHDEFHSDEFSKSDGPFEMVQLWVNLPSSHKMTPAKYQGVKDNECPRVLLNKAEVKVIAGEFNEATGPCTTFTKMNVYMVDTKSDCHLELPLEENTNTLVLVLRGRLTTDGKEVQTRELIIFESAGSRIELQTHEECKLLVLNGEPINEPVVQRGPFVMNTDQEILNAIIDFQNGKMGKL